jgi:arylsulfatase A-like enzyme
MDSLPGLATAKTPRPKAVEAREGQPAGGTTPATILLLAIGIGLIAGFLDLGLLIVKTRRLNEGFYHLSQDFVWLIPAGVAFLVLVPGAMLALVAQRRRGNVRPSLVVGWLVLFASLEVAARLPLKLWAVPLISGGLAVQSARRVRARPQDVLTLIRRLTPVLLGILAAIILVTAGGRAWSEHRAAATLPPPSTARNVLLIVWDTVRAANTSLHGYHRPTTPHLETLAARGVRFDLAFATSSWTLPSHASLFTGRWPHALGVDWTSPLRPDVSTLAESLAAHGYDTAGFVANLDYCGRETGLARGFGHYEDYPINPWDTFTRYLAVGRRLNLPSLVPALNGLVEKYTGYRPALFLHAHEHAKDATAVNRAFLHWLDGQRGRRRPFFAFLNFNDAHPPYEVPDPSVAGFGLRPSSPHDFETLAGWNLLGKASLVPRDVRMATDVYDDSIAALDRNLEVLLRELDRRGVLQDTLVIVTSDHGEHLGDHGLFFHGCSLYRQLVQVPLVIVGPDVPAGRAVADPVSLRDVPATVIERLRLGPDAPFPGRSLARFWDEGAEPMAGRGRSEPLLIQTGKPIYLMNQGLEPVAKGPMSSVVASGMHYIRMADRREELYLLGSDPEEQRNMVGSPLAAAALARLRQDLVSLFRKD